MQATERIELLLTRYRSKTITSAEFDELLVWMSGLNEEQSAGLAKSHLHLWEQAKAGRLPSTADTVDSDSLLRQLMKSDPSYTNKHTRRIGWRIAAAAAVLVIITGIYLLNSGGKKEPDVVAATQSTTQPRDILPIINQTVLTLPDGKQIILDSASTGSLIPSGSALVMKMQNGEIAYRMPENNTTPEYHTISVPRGGRPYRVLLADGSSVWLNAASSLRFPSFFNDKNRSVELTGEGFFDIESRALDGASADPASLPKRAFPFVVKLPRMNVEVLGTTFNIMAYEDEQYIQTTLLQGSIKITSGQRQKLVTPGKQALLTADGQLNLVPADTELVTAWVNGYFQFDKADVSAIMRQVGRWYDLDIEYNSKPPSDLFSGKIERALPLSSILNLLSSGQIKTVVKGRKLVVL